MKLHRALYLAAAVLALAAASATHAQTSVAVVAVRGTVSGSPESVLFSGEARVQNRLAPDPDFNSPNYVLTIDLTGVSGVGALSQKKYVISGPEIVQKKVALLHVVDITFPFQEAGTAALNARGGVASFTLGFDAQGTITSAVGSIDTPSF